MKVKYAALSYCWGGDPEQETTEENYNQRLQGRDLNTLPRLLAEAVEFTALCGLEYIWIDALCIVQDRQSDREHELRKLPETYANAMFTILASHAENVHQGLLPEARASVRLTNKLPRSNGASHGLASKAPIHGPLGLHNYADGSPWPALSRA
jgi:hypothetical protein